MFPSLPVSPLLAAALPISPTIFMAVTVVSACVCGIVVVFNYLSLKYKSTHRVCVASVVLLLAGILVADVSVGLTFQSDSSDLLENAAGKIALALLVLTAVAGLGGFLHCYYHRHRFRRGRKRALGSFVLSLLAIGVLFSLSSSSKHPHPAKAPRTKVELLPETDSYGRPLPPREPATPAPATPYPVTPAPAPAVSAPLATPSTIATPPPSQLLPRIITP
jgi:hypothetical protein